MTDDYSFKNLKSYLEVQIWNLRNLVWLYERSDLLTITNLSLELVNLLPFTCLIANVNALVLTSLDHNLIDLFWHNLLICTWKGKKLIRFSLTWLYFFFFFLLFSLLSLIKAVLHINTLSFELYHKMVLFRNSINICINWFEFCINWFKMNSAQRKEFNLINFFFWFFKFYVKFRFVNQKFLIYFFNKVDDFIRPMELDSDQNVSVSCKLYCSVFFNGWSHQSLFNVFIIDFIILNEGNHCLFFFLEFVNFFDEPFAIIFGFTGTAILIDILLSFL